MSDLIERVKKAIIGQGFPTDDLEDKLSSALYFKLGSHIQPLLEGIEQGEIGVDYISEALASAFADMDSPGACWRKQCAYDEWYDYWMDYFRENWLPSLILKIAVEVNGASARQPSLAG